MKKHENNAFVEIYVRNDAISLLGSMNTLIGVYHATEREVHLLDALTCSDANMKTLTLLCQSAVQRGQTSIAVDKRFVQEKSAQSQTFAIPTLPEVSE